MGAEEIVGRPDALPEFELAVHIGDGVVDVRTEFLDIVEMAPEAQAWFAEGIALHTAAAELEQRKDPESDSLLIKAADRLRAALGEEGRILVRASGTESVVDGPCEQLAGE